MILLMRIGFDPRRRVFLRTTVALAATPLGSLLADDKKKSKLTPSQERFFDAFEKLQDKTESIIETSKKSENEEKKLTQSEIHSLTISGKDVMQTMTWALGRSPNEAIKMGITESFKRRIPPRFAGETKELVNEFANSLVGDDKTAGFRTEVIALKSKPPGKVPVPGELLNARSVLTSSQRLVEHCNLSGKDTLNLVKVLTAGDPNEISSVISKFPCKEGRSIGLRDRVILQVNNHLKSRGQALVALSN